MQSRTLYVHACAGRRCYQDGVSACAGPTWFRSSAPLPLWGPAHAQVSTSCSMSVCFVVQQYSPFLHFSIMCRISICILYVWQAVRACMFASCMCDRQCVLACLHPVCVTGSACLHVLLQATLACFMIMWRAQIQATSIHSHATTCSSFYRIP